MTTPDSYSNISTPVYLLNLPERRDRLTHSLAQFAGKDEFDLTVVEACRHQVGAIGLWQSIVKVIQMAMEKDNDVIILCEDDHVFTPHYDKTVLFDNILAAAGQGAKILLGGISSFGQAIPLSENRCWVDRFQCTQFTIVYRSFFQEILDEPFTGKDAADLKFSEMTSHKMVFYPFISVQKDFGYSDIPVEGLPTGQYARLFDDSQQRLRRIYEVSAKYKAMRRRINANKLNVTKM